MLQRYKGQNLYNQSVKSYSEAMSEMGTYLLRDPPPPRCCPEIRIISVEGEKQLHSWLLNPNT